MWDLASADDDAVDDAGPPTTTTRWWPCRVIGRREQPHSLEIDLGEGAGATAGTAAESDETASNGAGTAAAAARVDFSTYILEYVADSTVGWDDESPEDLRSETFFLDHHIVFDVGLGGVLFWRAAGSDWTPASMDSTRAAAVAAGMVVEVFEGLLLDRGGDFDALPRSTQAHLVDTMLEARDTAIGVVADRLTAGRGEEYTSSGVGEGGGSGALVTGMGCNPTRPLVSVAELEAGLNKPNQPCK
jgi:hypothetical protein